LVLRLLLYIAPLCLCDWCSLKMAEHTSDSETTEAKVEVQLDMVVDVDVAAQYIAVISGFRVNQDVVEISNVDESEGCNAIVTCQSATQAKQLASAVNSTTQDTGVRAKLRGTLEPSAKVENIWEELRKKAGVQIECHRRKMEDVQLQIEQIAGHAKKKKRVELNEFMRQQSLKRPLQEKLHELELQQDEFCGFMDSLQARLELCTLQGKSTDDHLTKYCSEFELELRRFDQTLPVYARRTDILNAISSNQVCVILGETGSGKSTQIIQYIHAAGFHELGAVVCTQPRKVAALSLARRVSEEMRNERGLVGFRVGAQCIRSKHVAKLLYVTDHILLNECLKDPLLSKYSVILVDEAHERSIYSDLLLGFIKLALPRRSDLRVVIMSATINADLFVSYFSDIMRSGWKPPVLQISGRAFPVAVHYEDSSDSDYTTVACLKALEIHREQGLPGDILVFLTSPIETEKACKKLLSCCDRDALPLEVVELHGRLQVEEQQKVFTATPAGMRKVVFATNSAETSVTIPGIKYVVDSGRVKELSYDAKRNISSLSVQWVSQSSAEQRKGRAGRTSCGVCYRLYSHDDFEQMRQQSVPEILRIHLGQAILKLMMLGISKPMDFDFVEAPSRDAVENALSVLQDLGACDQRGITDTGKQLARLSLEPRLGKVVLIGIERGIALESALMAAVSSVGGSVFFRGGSDEQKKLADRKKTRFCDEWGDIITLVNVYKEWSTLGERSRNRWCVDNSINAKSMRTARDVLAEIRQTFKTELGVSISSEFAETYDTNDKMARVIFDCYFSNLCRFSGHEREGFVLAALPSHSMHIHPSSALTYIEELPKWIVYEQMLTTSRTFLLNATYVREEWVLDDVASGKLKLSMPDISSFIVEPTETWHIGYQCVRSLLFNKAEPKKELESQVANFSHSSKCLIDIVSLDGNAGGLLTLYATPSSQTMATTLLQSYVENVRQSASDECVEDQLLSNCGIRLVLERGGQIRTVLMPDEFRMVKVIAHAGPAVELRECIVRTQLEPFGDIEKIRREARSTDAWGIVTFKLPSHAELALSCRHSFSQFKLEACRYAVGSKCSSATVVYTVKVVAARRPVRGYGYAQFERTEDVTRVASRITKFVVRKECGDVVQNDNIEVQIDKKNNTQIYLRFVPTWANEALVKADFQRAVEALHVRILNVILPRDNIQPNNHELFNRFQRTVVDGLRSADIEEDDYQMTAVTPNEKSFNFVAYLKFHDSLTARKACGLLEMVHFNRTYMDATLLLKFEFCLPSAINRYCGEQLQKKSASLQQESRGPVRINSKQWQNGCVLTSVETCFVEDLVLAREELAPLLGGRQVTLSMKEMSFAKSSSGAQQLSMMEHKLGVKTRVDDRQSSVFIHATNRQLADEAERELTQLLSAKDADVCDEISLRSTDYPRGLMKALVIQYGLNLEQLKQKTGVDLLELILRQHKIRVQGSNDAYDKLIRLINEKASTVMTERCLLTSSCPSTDQRRRDCPVCLSAIERNSVFVLESCSHVFCRDCAVGLVENAIRNNELPIRCCAEDCHESVVIQDLRNLLGGRLTRLYDTAIRVFLLANGDTYSCCITTDCKMIYRRSEPDSNSNDSMCSECGISLCTACNTVSHPGLRCSMLRSEKDRAATAKWIAANPDDRCECPRCHVGIEKDGGCMHMECTACHAHFCWHCRNNRQLVFTTSRACYDHLVQVHGKVF